MDKKSQTDQRRANGLKGYYTRRAQIVQLRQVADTAEREYFARQEAERGSQSTPIRKTPREIEGRLLALPTDVHLADINWSPVTTVETAPAPHSGRIASDRQRSRGKRQHATDARQQATAQQRGCNSNGVEDTRRRRGAGPMNCPADHEKYFTQAAAQAGIAATCTAPKYLAS